ncbi:MAG: hypothetical protein ACRENY_09145 [Candidatus Dormibacteria bacterium]
MAEQERDPRAESEKDDVEGERFAADDNADSDDVGGHHQARAYEDGDDTTNPLSHTGRGA